MTLAGTAKNYAKSDWTRGPGDLWLATAVPAATGKLTLFTDGTPEVTANPNAVHVGGTVEGCKMSIKGTYEEEYIDEVDGPINTFGTQTAASIEGAFVQILDFDLDLLMNQALTALTGTGYEGVTFGGKRDVTLIPVAHIAKIPGTAFYQVFMLYAAMNVSGHEFSTQKSKRGESPFSWKGHAISTRAEGDQMGQFWKQTA